MDSRPATDRVTRQDTDKVVATDNKVSFCDESHKFAL